MFRSLFTAIDSSEKSRLFISALSEIVERLDLHMHVAVLTPTPMISPKLAPFGGLYQPAFALRADAQAEEVGVRAQLIGLGARVRVTSEFDDVAFLPSDLKRMHPIADLNVIGAVNSWEVAWLRHHVIQSLVFNSGTPVLLMPAKPVLRDLEHIVVGWKPSAEATRTLHDVAEIASAGALIELVTISPNTAEDEHGLSVVEYLQRHGFRADLHRLQSRGDNANQLQDYAKRRKASMLAVGAYGHSRFREMILGGVTRSFLQEVRLPTLLSR